MANICIEEKNTPIRMMYIPIGKYKSTHVLEFQPTNCETWRQT